MDGNKDEALKCLKIGENALGLGDRVRALKFITKAQRLDPSLPVDDLLSNLELTNDSSKSPEDISGASAGDSSGVRRRVPETGSSSRLGSGLGSGLGLCTDEQIIIVREIRRKKDYYDILGLNKSCSVEEIRKAYRKLSLKVHPDKNKALGSEEAFKKVSKAFQCLNNNKNRKQYDLNGSNEPVYQRQTGRNRANQGFHYDVDAEEIFRNFFFSGSNPRATTRTGQNGSDGFNIKTLFQLLPVFFILFFSFFPTNEPVYSLSRTYSYGYRLATQNGIPFFVKSRNFDQNYPLTSPERVDLEGKIENEYLTILSHNCRLEVQRLQWGYNRQTPNCDTLKKFDALLVS